MGPEESEQQADAIAQIVRLFAILRRRWLIILVTTVLCVAAAALSLRFIAPRWEAKASIVLHMAGPQVLDKIQGVTEQPENGVFGYKEYYQTQRMIMRSRAVAQRALDRLRAEGLDLSADPEFMEVAKVPPTERKAALEQVDPIEQLRDLIAVREVRSSRVVEIAVEYGNPELAAQISNAVADAYIGYVQSTRSRLGERAESEMESEREKAHARVQEAERELDQFKRSNSITSISLSDRQNVITQDILTLSSRAKEAEAERIRLENTLTQAKRLKETGDIALVALLPEEKRETFEEIRRQKLEAEAQFHAVDIEYGPKHEEHRKAKSKLDLIEAALEREAQSLIAGLVTDLEKQLAAAEQTERDLGSSLEREHQKALALGTLERQYRELEREAGTAEEDYLKVVRRETEIGLSNRVEQEGIELLDRATTPSEPVFPQKGLLMAIAGVVGLGLGSLLALSIDFRDQRIRGLTDLERTLSGFGIPVLGQLPLLPSDNRLGTGNARAQRRQRDLYTHRFPQSLMAERCRGIRTSIAFVQGTEAVRTLMITSPSSSEGKSSTALNLALSFTQTKKKVLLIDADMRRPRLHQVLGQGQDQGPGLVAALSGETSLEDAVVSGDPKDCPDNLFLLPCTNLPEHPAELLDTPGFRQLLVEARERFDVIIVDSPPVLPVTDPLIIAREVDGTVIVSRCGQTKSSELQRALSSLAQSDANLLGVVLNEVDARSDGYAYNPAYYTYGPKERDTGTA